MSRARELAKAGGLQQRIVGVSSFVGVSTFAQDVSFYKNITVIGDLNVTGDLSYDESIASNQRISGISTLNQTETNDIIVSAGATVTGALDVNGGADIANGLVANSAQVSDLTSGRVVIAGTSGELEDDAALSFSGGTLSATTFNGNLATTNLTGTITNAQLGGSISNDKMASATVSYGGVQLSLGGSDATPAFNLADATGLPISSGVSGLASNMATFLATPSSANLRSTVTNETGSGSLVFGTNPTLAGATLSSHLLPNANGTINLGASATRFANVYSSDLDLSNEAKGPNSIDGTWGSYLIEEGEEHLYITNRRSGRRYRFMMEEV